MKIIKTLLCIILSMSCFVMPVKAEGGSFITDAGFAVTYWLASQGLRFSGDLLKYGSGMWDLFQTFLLNKGLTDVDIEALKAKAEQQRYEYDQTGKQIMQIGAELYNYISEFKDWLIQQFTITSNSENDKKVIFSNNLYNDVVIYTGSFPGINSGAQVLGTNESYFGYNANNTGFFPLEQEAYKLQNYPGRVCFYNFSINGNFAHLVACIAFEVPSDFQNIWTANVCFFLGDYRYQRLYSAPNNIAIYNGKRYCYYCANFTSGYSYPTTFVPGIPTFDSTENNWDGYWYDCTFSPDAAIVGGEVWGADLGAAPTTVSKSANLVADSPLTNSEEFENFIKNSLVSGWEIATPTDTDATTDIPSDIADGEVLANWQSIFPFSLPYDYYLLCNLFVADPERPEFDIHILGQTFSYDLSPLDGVMVIFRDCVCLIFIGGLIWATKEIIQ